ncbi:DUF1128 domain-containing protein [Bacillus chungangensis]|uniref:UPF0435 protein J2S08_001476 n=1 Tax=Bacillus chungangensis TaxID=587633 RepID=A0ABT9WQS3_9BACI|nr:DUF1128 domain-containing protein [Bacillus chungangensis]MDQ0175642.1 uncharacterized protein YfkK (UPF0435 family) [Bacillus chungangensis]
MALSNNTPDNIHDLIKEITKKLKMVNAEAIQSSDYSEDQYEDLKEIYEMVMKKQSFSPNEMQAIVEELGYLRK